MRISLYFISVQIFDLSPVNIKRISVYSSFLSFVIICSISAFFVLFSRPIMENKETKMQEFKRTPRPSTKYDKSLIS